VPDPVPSPPSPVSAVPRRMRQLCAAVALVVVAAMTYVAITLQSSSTGVVRFHTSDQVAIGGLGLVLGAAILALGRSRVDADASGVRIRNIVGERVLPWSMVRAVRFDRKSSWATLLLRNDDEVAVLAVQAVDKERAVRAVEGLRALLAAARAQEPVPPPLLYPTRE
jgi:Bacterial PH domain